MNKKLKSLVQSKQKNIVRATGAPSQKSGRDGDFHVRKIVGQGIFLFYKWNNRWYSTRMSEYRQRTAEHKQPVKVPIGIKPSKTGELTLDSDGNIKARKAKDKVNQVVSMDALKILDVSEIQTKRTSTSGMGTDNGGNADLTLKNTTGHSRLSIETQDSSYDPFIQFAYRVLGESESLKQWTFGMDNSSSDTLKFHYKSTGTAPLTPSSTSGGGSSDSSAELTTAGALTLKGGLTLAGDIIGTGNQIIDVTGDITLDADGDQVTIKFGGAAGQIDFTNENSGDGVIQQKVDAKDLVVKQYDGNEVARFTDGGDVKITNVVYFAAETANTIGNGATGVIDWNVSQKQKVTITGTGITCNFMNPAGPCNLMLKVVQGDGSDVIGTWDTDIKWAGGSAPTLSTGNGNIDIISFYFDGTNYFGVGSLNFS